MLKVKSLAYIVKNYEAIDFDLESFAKDHSMYGKCTLNKKDNDLTKACPCTLVEEVLSSGMLIRTKLC